MLSTTPRRLRMCAAVSSGVSLQVRRARVLAALAADLRRLHELAVAQLADLLPQLTALMKAAGGEPALKVVV